MTLSFIVESVGKVFIMASNYETEPPSRAPVYRIVRWSRSDKPQIGEHYVTSARGLWGVYAVGNDVASI